LAGEGAGEEGGRELLHLPARLGQPRLKLFGQRKQALHAPHDFLLLGKWSDWFATTPRQPVATASRPAEPATTQTIADAVRACNGLQANQEVPISCGTEYVNGVPAMIVGFPTAAVAEAYMRQIADQVTGPFCEAANRARQRAAVFINLANTRARQFDCQERKWSAWFPLSSEETPAPGALELN